MICTLLKVSKVYLNQWSSDAKAKGKRKEYRAISIKNQQEEREKIGD